MTYKVSDLINISSITLADFDNTRYPLIQKVDAVNRAVSHFQREVDYFVNALVLNFTPETTPLFRGFNIGDISTKILRAEYAGPNSGRGRVHVPFIGSEYLDKQFPYWRDETGSTIREIVVNHQNEGEFFVFPELRVADVDTDEIDGILMDTGSPNLNILGTSGIIPEDFNNYLHLTYAERQPEFVIRQVAGEDIIVKAGQDADDNTEATLPIYRDLADVLSHYVAYSCLNSASEIADARQAQSQLQLYTEKVRQFAEAKARGYVPKNEIQTTLNTGFTRNHTADGVGYSHNRYSTRRYY